MANPVFKFNLKQHEEGFSTAEWIVIMGFTLLLLAGMVQGLYIENLRATTISALRDSARVGAREGDLEQIALTPTTTDNDEVINRCRQRLIETLDQATKADTSQANCSIGFVTVNGRNQYYVESQIGDSYSNVAMLPILNQAFKPRLQNLSARFFSSESAR